jgi:bacteriocin biosynthesis cyclodehydratase domain-containing protein
MDACIQRKNIVRDSPGDPGRDIVPAWVLSPAWRLEVVDDFLVVNGGADEVYVVDEAPAHACAKLIAVCNAREARQWQQDPVLGAAIRQLRRLGALVPIGSTTIRRPALVIRWAGQPLPVLPNALQAHGWTCLSEPDADGNALTLIVRTTASWSDLLANYQAAPLNRTHVLLDLAYHHTVGMGPLVVPGQTACLACMGHRVMRRWGDLPGPEQPAMAQRAAGVAALLADAAVLGPRLVERAFTLDLRSLQMHSSQVFVLPDCPVCAAMESSGFARLTPLPLPWLVARPGPPHDPTAHSI